MAAPGLSYNMSGLRTRLGASGVVRIATGGDSMCEHHPFNAAGYLGNSLVTALRRGLDPSAFGKVWIGDTLPFASPSNTETSASSGGVRCGPLLDSSTPTHSIINFKENSGFGDPDKQAYCATSRYSDWDYDSAFEHRVSSGLNPDTSDYPSSNIYTGGKWYEGKDLAYRIIYRVRTGVAGDATAIFVRPGSVVPVSENTFFNNGGVPSTQLGADTAFTTATGSTSNAFTVLTVANNGTPCPSGEYPGVDIYHNTNTDMSALSIDFAEWTFYDENATDGIMYMGTFASGGVNPTYWDDSLGQIDSRPFSDANIQTVITTKLFPAVWFWFFNDTDSDSGYAARYATILDRINEPYATFAQPTPLHVVISGYYGTQAGGSDAIFEGQDEDLYDMVAARSDAAFISGYQIGDGISGLGDTPNVHFKTDTEADTFWAAVQEQMESGTNPSTGSGAIGRGRGRGRARGRSRR